MGGLNASHSGIIASMAAVVALMLAPACTNAPPAYVISSAGVGPIALGMTLDEARRAAPEARFERTEDGDGAALVAVTFPGDQSLVIDAREDDPGAPVDWTRRIEAIEAYGDQFRTVEGAHPGATAHDLARMFGPALQVDRSEIESREFVTYTRQPQYLTIRLDPTSGQFDGGAQGVNGLWTGALVLSIAVARQEAR